jgi:NADH:ubiquinone oxidoreductase subunit 6 (subunit J)
MNLIQKFLLWFSDNRKPIGWVLIIFSVLSALINIVNDNYSYALMHLAVAFLILTDRTMQQ